LHPWYRVEKNRTPGPIFGSPVAGTPVRRGGALVRRPATAGPPGATLKAIGAACFMTRGCTSRMTDSRLVGLLAVSGKVALLGGAEKLIHLVGPVASGSLGIV
jgi:hypothetical protein